MNQVNLMIEQRKKGGRLIVQRLSVFDGGRDRILGQRRRQMNRVEEQSRRGGEECERCSTLDRCSIRAFRGA